MKDYVTSVEPIKTNLEEVFKPINNHLYAKTVFYGFSLPVALGCLIAAHFERFKKWYELFTYIFWLILLVNLIISGVAFLSGIPITIVSVKTNYDSKSQSVQDQIKPTYHLMYVSFIMDILLPFLFLAVLFSFDKK